MSPIRSFFALLRYQALISPVVWIIPAVIAFQLAIINPSKLVNDLTLLTAMAGTCMWMPMIMAWMLFASELMGRSRWITPQTHVMANALNAEFLITRAINRSTIFWSRCALYWIMLLISAFVWVSSAAFKPGFTLEFIREPEAAQVQANHYLKNIPGSYLDESSAANNRQKTTIRAPHGTLFIKSSAAAILILSGLVAQLFVLVIRPTRFATVMMWTVFSILVAIPVLLNYSGRKYLESAMFQILHHPWLTLALSAALLSLVCTVGTKLYKEQEFA
jgi:hypothetical protein